MLSPTLQAFLALFIFLLMLGMGATLRLSDFRQALKTPRGILIGFLSQFGLMPMIAFGLAAALDLPPEAALGLILVGCTPGGTTSNLFTYFSRGDVALSISMTVASTVTAFFMMPLLLLLYTSAYVDAGFVIPYANITITLALVLIPATLGMLIRAKSPPWAKVTERVGGTVGVMVILMTIVGFFSNADNRELFANTGAEIFLAAVLLGVVGYIVGYAFATLAGLSFKHRKTVSLETGTQNTPLTIAVILLSFPEPDAIVWLPLLYALFVVITSVAATGVFTLMNQRHPARLAATQTVEET